MTASYESVAPRGLRARLQQVRESRLVRQNLVLFVGGVVAGVGGFVYHAIAGRVLGPKGYGEVASLVSIYAVGTSANLILVLVLARYAAHLIHEGRPGAIRHLMGRTGRVLAVPAVGFVILLAALSVPGAAFLRLSSPIPLVWLGAAIAAYAYVAIPRGVLQGTQRFSWLAANLSLEIVVRTCSLVVLLAAGLAVTGSVIALLCGVIFAYFLGMSSTRDLLRQEPEKVHLRAMADFAVTAAAGTVGVLLLYNTDVVLAKHYLGAHQAGIYAGLNKIGTIIYFLTLSVSQVLFPRVVEAVAKRDHPGRLLFLSGGLLSLLGLAAIVIFGLIPGLVVRILFGGAFQDAQPYVLAVGFIGLAISLDNLLVQFLMAVHDRLFVPLLGAACLLEAILIVLFHGGVGQVVSDVVIAVYLLLGALVLRSLLLLPRLHPGMLHEDAVPAAEAAE